MADSIVCIDRGTVELAVTTLEELREILFWNLGTAWDEHRGAIDELVTNFQTALDYDRR